MSWMKKHFVYLISILIFSIFLCGSASAANINVNNSTGIQNAINSASNGDTLNLSAGTYKEHDINVNKNLTITGPTVTGNNSPTAVVDGQQVGIIFNIPSGVTVTLQYLLFQNGTDGINNAGNVTVIRSNIYNNTGNGICNSGILTLIGSSVFKNTGCGISNDYSYFTVSNLNVTNSSVFNNSAGGIQNFQGQTATVTNSNISNNTEYNRGGGIYNEGTLTLTNSNVFNNTADYEGGGIYNDGTLTVINSQVYNNLITDGWGGGIYNSNSLTLAGSSVYNNSVRYTYREGDGGGIYNIGHFLTVTGSNIYNNNAEREGGGIMNRANGGSTVVVTDSNIYGNTAQYGGGIINFYSSMSVTSCNIYNNTADMSGGGISNGYYGSMSVRFCRIIGNEAGYGSDIYDMYSYSETVDATLNWWGSNEDPGSRVYGDVTISPWLVFNLTANPILITFGTQSYITADLLHDSDGGYHAPSVGHVQDGTLVIFNTTLGIINSQISTVNGTAIAILGSGSVNGVTDVSATLDSQTLHKSVQIVPPTVFNTRSLETFLKIQDAINDADTLNGDTLTLTAGIFNEHDILVNKNLTITGPTNTGNNLPTAMVDAQNVGRVFKIPVGINATLKYLLIQNGNSTTETSTDGGGIFNEGILNIKNCTITKNTAGTDGNGGGIYNDGNMALNGSNISNNTAKNAYGGGIGNDGTLTVTESSISNNTATLMGGAIYNTGTLILTGSHLYKNTATNNGGGIFNSGNAVLTFNNIIGNIASSGADIYCVPGKAVNATLNWWGSNNHPNSKVFGNVTVNPWLVLNITANPTHIGNEGTSNITADLCHDSDGGYHNPTMGHVLDGILVSFNTTLGTINNLVSTVNGAAIATLRSGSIGGISDVSATLDSQTVHTSVQIVLSIINTRTLETFSKIQAAIDDIDTLNGDTLNISAGSYKEHDILVNKNLTIKGPIVNGNIRPTAIVDAQKLGRVFIIPVGVNVNIYYLLIQNGTATVVDDIYNGGGIYNAGTLTLTGSEVYQNTAQNNGGGGIGNEGTMTITNSKIYKNTAGTGGGVENGGTLTLTGSEVYQNTAEYGGAIYTYAPLNVTSSNLYNNTAITSGGGINIQGSATFTGCNIYNNTATYMGGGINTYGNTILTNSNVYQNTAQTGGGISNFRGVITITGSNLYKNSATNGGGISQTEYGTTTLTFCRIFANTANNGTAVYCYGGEGYEGTAHVIAAFNWWGSNNNPNSKVVGDVTVTPWLVLNVTANQDNITIGGASNISADLCHDSDGGYHDPTNGHVPDGVLVQFNGNLGFLIPINVNTFNGSAVSVFTGSNPGVAIIKATVDNENATTQLNVIQNDVYVSTTGNDTTGDGTLNNPYQTILKGISMVNTGKNVHISNGTYTGTKNTNIVINKNINIIGQNSNSTIINAQNTSRIFIINSGCNVTILNLTLQNGNSTNYGGAIYNGGNLTVTNSIFTGNTASSFGGAIYNYGITNVNFNRITTNTAIQGRAIYNNGGEVNAEYNWWGSNNNPSGMVYGFTINKWIVLNITVNPTIINTLGKSNITATLLYDSNGGYHDPASGHVPDGIPVTFTTSMGTINSPAYTLNGTVNTTFNSGIVGVADVSGTVDNQTVHTSVKVINNSVLNTRTLETFATIQYAIDDTETLNGDTLRLTSGIYNEHDVWVKKSLIITGPQISGYNLPTAVVDAQNQGRVFNISFGVIVTLQNLLIQNGTVTTDPSYGGGIYNSGILFINNCTIQKNTANRHGGGIYNTADGNVTITNSNVYNNTATNDGGGILNNGNLTLSNSNIYNNTAHDGGGILNYGNLTLTNSNIYQNTATTNNGGAIYNSGTLNLTNSTINNNTATHGGGIFNDENAYVTLTGSNVCNNTATTSSGGGIYNNVGTVTITNSSLNNNHAPNNNGGAIYNAGTVNLTNTSVYNNNAINGGAIYTYYRPVTLTGSNLFNNTATGCGGAIYNGGVATLTFCRITANTAPSGPDIYCTGTATATLNWWGSNQDPNSRVSGSVTVTPWLVLNITANPTTINTTGKSNITAKLLYDSNGGYHDPANGHVPDEIPVTFATTLGTISSPVFTTNGIGKTTLIRGTTNGVANVSASVDNQTVYTLITINPDTTPPTVLSTNPAQYAVNLPSNQIFTLTYSKPIKVKNLNLIILKTSTGTVIPTTITTNENILTITPNSPLGEAKYLLIIYSGSITDLAGNPAAALSRTYSVGAQPYVTSTNPANYAVNVPRNTAITATFNEPIVAKYLTLIYLKTATGGILVPTTKSVSGNTLTITPNTPLAAGTRYMLLIYTFAVTDLSGNSNVNKAISFTTGAT